MSWCNSILLERAGIVVTADLCRCTIRIGADQAGLTVTTSRRYPFDTHSVADFEVGVFCPSTQSRNDSNALVTTNLALLGWSWKPCPRITYVPSLKSVILFESIQVQDIQTVGGGGGRG